ncbi:Vacuolar protein sorting-associated protein 54 [Turnera subulata]|uniref:Vacuolar protein sorting-associated protein 54 n=1 Tax=Turnera subulata TaxID=218843 RepID=A0A9Q0FF04_9ROSI|nr:Vacuolar protein sorting-associated protein 54 [Turnera subulata]
MDPQPSHSQSGRSLAKSDSTSTSNSAGIQSLSSVLNNPLASSSDASWIGWLSSSSTAIPPPDFAPLLSKTATPSDPVSRSDFQAYLSSVSEPYHRFEDIRNHASKEATNLDSIAGQGEALVACLREVPSLYFKEDFALEDGPTFRAACPFSSVSQNLVLQEKLSQYLDVVELHLVKEISLRSNSFFEAQGQLEDLNAKIVQGCARIRQLRDTIRLLDKDLVESAREIHDLNATRSNMLALQHKLRLILYVNQALSTLKLLVASADCAGALDVTDDLQHLLNGDELTGLHCFRHLRDHVAAAIDSINSILSAEFVRASMYDGGNRDADILSRARARASVPENGNYNEVRLDEEETSNFQDRLLPLIVGLLRTAKLPSVLRVYRETLTANMKTAIKTTVAELLIVLVRPIESDYAPGERTVDADGGGLSLASKLRSLQSESFVQLLGAIFQIVQAHLLRAAEVKKAIEWIMCNPDGHYAADSVAAAIAVGAAAAETGQESDSPGGSVPISSQKSTAKILSFQMKANDVSDPSNVSRNFRADVLRENAEAVFAACDAAHGRWAKLLGVRALIHPRLKLVEFLSIYNITQEFIAATEKIGGRLGYSIRGALQSQAKAFIDFQHELRMTKIKAVLDQETWVEIDAPNEFQAIVSSLTNPEALLRGDLEDAQGNYAEMAARGGGLLATDAGGRNAQQQHASMESSERSLPAEATQNNEANGSTSTSQSSHSNTEHGRSTTQILFFGGVGYHMVNCGLILLKIMSEYLDMNNFLPALSSEIVHRVVEILKFFNTRTCQLVLGAGAMQVSGLRSITAKHLALASQVISFVYAVIPVCMDYKVHRDEIHTKLVQIMRERLLVHLRGLPQIVESWNRPEDADPQPSQFARSLSREVGYLQRVLTRTLHEADVQAIFRQVVVIFHTEISDAFSRFEISTPQARERLNRDIRHILGCIRSLPADNLSESGTPNWGKLDEFLVQRFGAEAG